MSFEKQVRTIPYVHFEPSELLAFFTLKRTMFLYGVAPENRDDIIQLNFSVGPSRYFKKLDSNSYIEVYKL